MYILAHAISFAFYILRLFPLYFYALLPILYSTFRKIANFASLRTTPVIISFPFRNLAFFSILRSDYGFKISRNIHVLSTQPFRDPQSRATPFHPKAPLYILLYLKPNPKSEFTPININQIRNRNSLPFRISSWFLLLDFSFPKRSPIRSYWLLIHLIELPRQRRCS